MVPCPARSALVTSAWNRRTRQWWKSVPKCISRMITWQPWKNAGTSMEEQPELKPCPFCGSVAKLEEVESGDSFRFSVYCTNDQYCGGTTSRCRSAAKAIEFWNRRVTG
jgi:Restriction alleviation protein Lar